MENEKREKALANALAQIEKQYGKGAIMRLGDSPSNLEISVIPTGCLEVDMALGIFGLPRGRIIEIFGPESSGKTTLALHVIAEAQRQGGAAAFIDVEHALDPLYAKNIGVDTDNLYVAQPDAGEQALEMMETLIRSGAIDVVVLDSVAALVPKSEIDGSMGESHMAAQARLMSQALRKLTAAISKSNTAAIFINQLREKVGIMFGNPEVTPGGRALKFYSSVRIDIRKGETLKTGDTITGNKVKVKIVKNKVAPPFRAAECEMQFGKGISKSAGILNLGVQFGIINKSGAWFSYNDVRIGQGRENAKKYIEDNPEAAEEMKARILANVSSLPMMIAEDEGESAAQE